MSKQSSYFSKGGISEETEMCSPLTRHHLWQQQDPRTLQIPSPVTEVVWDVVTSGADWDCLIYRFYIQRFCILGY